MSSTIRRLAFRSFPVWFAVALAGCSDYTYSTKVRLVDSHKVDLRTGTTHDEAVILSEKNGLRQGNISLELKKPTEEDCQPTEKVADKLGENAVQVQRRADGGIDAKGPKGEGAELLPAGGKVSVFPGPFSEHFAKDASGPEVRLPVSECPGKVVCKCYPKREKTMVEAALELEMSKSSTGSESLQLRRELSAKEQSVDLCYQAALVTSWSNTEVSETKTPEGSSNALVFGILGFLGAGAGAGLSYLGFGGGLGFKGDEFNALWIAGPVVTVIGTSLLIKGVVNGLIQHEETRTIQPGEVKG